MILGYIDPGSGLIFTSALGGILAFLLSILGLFSLFFKKIFKFLRKYRKILLFLLLIAIISGIILFMRTEKIPFHNKIVILGFDGLSPEVIEPMMEKGLLPNFSRLKEQGSYRLLATTNPPPVSRCLDKFYNRKKPRKKRYL